MAISYVKAATAALLLGTASGHMVMNRPIPFNPEKASTFPLDAPGGRFPWPCQGMTTVAHRTVVVAGETTLVNFTGAAPHGGGSCQFGINFHSASGTGAGAGAPYTADPAHWKTIYTIIGGCPAKTAGNLEDPAHYRGLDPNGRPDAVHCGDDKGADCIRQFAIPIPRDTPTGDATFAWIWYNRITANEVYMTCAPITVVGGVEDKEKGSKFVEGLPQMFLANIKGFANCTTSTTGEQGSFNIPNPGRWGVQLEVPDPKAAGNCPVAEPARFVDLKAVGKVLASSSSPALATVTRVTGTTPTSSSKTTSYTATITTTVRPTVTVEVSSSPPSGFVTIQTVPNPTSSQSASTRSSVPPSGSNSYYVPVPGSVPCEHSGQLVCIGESAFGICNAGFAAPQMLNKEQICKDGEVTLRGY